MGITYYGNDAQNIPPLFPWDERNMGAMYTHLSKLPLPINHFEHWPHEKGFSPVYTFKLPNLKNNFEH